MQNTDRNPSLRGIGHGETRYQKYKGLTLGGGQAYDILAD
jgi:hypothetical protein